MALFAVAADVGAQAPEGPAAVPLEDLLDAPSLAPFSRPAISTDGGLVAYVVTDNGRREEPDDSVLHRTGVAWFGIAGDIWIVDVTTGAQQNLTNGANNWSPSWSPDGRLLAFLSDRGSAQSPGPARLWVWDRGSETLRQVSDADVREGYHGLRWADAGRSIIVSLFPHDLTPAAYAAQLRGDEPAAAQVQRQGDEPGASVNASTARVFDYDPAAPDAAASPDQVNLDLWRRDVGTIDVETGALRRLLTGARVFAYTVSVDGARIAFARFAGADPANPGRYLFDLLVQDVAGGDTTRAAVDVPLDLIALGQSFSWSPTAHALAYRTGGPATADEIFVVDARGSAPRRIAEGPPSAELGWQLPAPVWSPDGTHVFFARHGELWRAAADGSGAHVFARLPGRRLEVIAPADQRLWSPDGGRTAVLELRDAASKRTGLARVDLATGTVRPIFEEDRRWGGYGTEPTVAADGSALVYVAEAPRNPPDLWLARGDLSTPRRLTEVAPALTRQAFASARPITWHSAAGDTLHGALVLPVGYEEGKRYPLIVKVYGGSAISDDLNRFGFASAPFENLQVFASRGYALLLADSKLRVGTPMSDLAATVLPGIDRAVELGVADPDRIGVMGHSYGGYSTLALLVQSTRFRAGVMRAGMGNLISSYGQLSNDGTNYGLAWAETGQGRMGGSPWEQRDRYIENSPVFLLDRVTAPLLIIHGADDDAVPAFLADEVFTGLRRLGKVVRYARYDGEGHWEGGWRRANQLDALKRIIDWFDTHLRGER